MASTGRLAFGVSALIGFIASSLFFAYHSPGALEVSLQEKYHLSTGQIGLFFTIYSLPNMVMTVFAGVAIDKIGLKRVGFILLLLIGGGSAIFALAPYLSQSPYVMMAVGRFVVGLGGESIITFQQAACAFWFGGGPHEGKSFGTALAVQQSIGSAASFFILEIVARKTSVEFALWFVVLFCACSGVGLFFYAVLERANVTYLVEEQKRTVNLYPCSFLFCFPAKKHKPRMAAENDVEEIATKIANDSFFTTFRKLGAMFWVQNFCIFFIVSILYTSANFFPFLLQAKKEDHGYGMSKVEAGQCASMIYWLVIIAPLGGALLDRCGRRLTTQILCTSGAIALFLVMYFTDVSPWILIPGLGIMFAFLEQNSLSILTMTFQHLGCSVEGTAFGIMGVFLNTGLMVMAPLVDIFYRNMGTYRSQALLYICFLSMGLAGSLLLRCLDKTGILDSTCPQTEPLVEFDQTSPARGAAF